MRAGGAPLFHSSRNLTSQCLPLIGGWWRLCCDYRRWRRRWYRKRVCRRPHPIAVQLLCQLQHPLHNRLLFRLLVASAAATTATGATDTIACRRPRRGNGWAGTNSTHPTDAAPTAHLAGKRPRGWQPPLLVR